MNKASLTHVLNQRLISYAMAHGCEAYRQYDDVDDPETLGVIVETEWINIYNGEQGIDYTLVKTFRDLRALLGY